MNEIKSTRVYGRTVGVKVEDFIINKKEVSEYKCSNERYTIKRVYGEDWKIVFQVFKDGEFIKEFKKLSRAKEMIIEDIEKRVIDIEIIKAGVEKEKAEMTLANFELKIACMLEDNNLDYRISEIEMTTDEFDFTDVTIELKSNSKTIYVFLHFRKGLGGDICFGTFAL